MVPITQMLANRSNYGKQRNTDGIKYIVIHYTANDGDSDQNNGKYFQNNVTGTSSHFFVDSDSITQRVPDDYVAYSVGGNKYNNNGGRLYGQATNENTINIELCDDNKNGDIYPSEATINNAVELTRYLMKKYNIPKENVIRHYDVNGKPCPAYWTDDTRWQNEFWNKLDGTTQSTATNTNNNYYPAFNNGSIVSGLNSIGIDSSFNNRKKIAEVNGISNYTGTAQQNIQLCNLARQGKLAVVGNTSVAPAKQYFSRFNSGSIVNGLKSIGADTSFNYRKQIATVNGITNYTGSAAQNITLCNLAKNGVLVKP